jgi:hypothetical protein
LSEPGANLPAVSPLVRKRQGPLIAAILGATAAAIVGYAWVSQRHEHAEPPSGLYVSATELSAAYLANEQDAKRLYGERWLSVTGVIAAVRTGEGGQVDVAFTTASGNNSYQVHALFSGDADDIVAELKAGQTLTATCKVSRIRPALVLRECVVNAISSLPGGPTASGRERATPTYTRVPV